ncbi:Hypp4134 [Branchiostoma lanceolatum]|uniref:Hypp4134 protein n=1 Tax=Branchiostoma lanceolatum TaxID=7740 RepID=A0A8K0EWQ7_BRALA|nr:Hypp4134 [Branchiostoma lanceolatum]
MNGAMSGTLRRPKSLQGLNLPSPTGKKGGGNSSSTTTITITKDNPLGGQKGEQDRKVSMVTVSHYRSYVGWLLGLKDTATVAYTNPQNLRKSLQDIFCLGVLSGRRLILVREDNSSGVLKLRPSLPVYYSEETWGDLPQDIGAVYTIQQASAVTYVRDQALRPAEIIASLPDRLLGKTDSQSEELALAHVTELIPETVDSPESPPTVKKTSTSAARMSRRTDPRYRSLNS